MKLVEPRVLRDDPLLIRVWEDLGRPSRCAVAGGYLRDRLLGRTSNDLDLTIDGDTAGAARPAKRLAKALGVRAHLLGNAPHEIWRIETSSLKVELWPLGGLTQEDDILRRDFSCNALSWELPDGPLVDLAGGLDDLGGGRLRAISRANLEDDPVRLLRAPRFLAQLPDFTLDDQTRSWIEELAPSLAKAPLERIGQELLKLLRGPMAARGLGECLALNLLGPASPAADKIDTRWLTANLEAADTLTNPHHAGGQASFETSPGQGAPAPQKDLRHCGAGVSPAGGRSGIPGDAARLAFLFRGWGPPPDSALTAYSWPRADRENALRAARLLESAREMVNAPAADRRELAWRAGAAFPALIALAAAVEPGRTGWRRWWRQWSRNPDALIDPRPLLSGDEIADLTGVEPGPELGGVVRGLLRAQVRREVRSRGGAVVWLRRRR